MASQPKPTRKRDKVKGFFRNSKTRQPPESTSSIVVATQPPPGPIPPQSSSDNVASTAPNAPTVPPPPIAQQKAFVKTKVLEKDIAVLSITYILAENPELKRLIHLIVEIHDKDEEGQLSDVLEICARFSVKLTSAIKAPDYRAEATESITKFIKTVERVNSERDVLSLEDLKRMVEDDITKIEVSFHLLGALNRLLNLNVINSTLGASITILSIVKDASAAIPITYVQSIFGGVVNLLTAVAQTRSNYDDMRQMAATAGEFAVSCAVICSDRTTEPSKELKRALNKFAKTLEDIAKECDELSRLNPFWRYLQNNMQKNALLGLQTKLKRAIETFQAETQIHMQLDLKDISKKLDDATLISLPNHPKYKRNEYLRGSRDDVVEYISGWIDTPNDPILWIHGAAGLGKSTIGQQLVHILEDAHRLAGGVFLSNLPKEHPETVIQMISRQLGEMHPQAIVDIAKAARKLNGPHRPLQDYFTAYIIDPIHQLAYPYKLVVVIDGVEEWTNHEAFLAELAALAPIISSSSLKFILTSRPSHSIERILTKIPVQQYPLPPVSDEIIEHYFTHHFENIDWRARKPDQLTIRRLATQAEGLLIWAATVRSLLSNEFDERYPHQILDHILWSEEKLGTRSGEQLECLYRDAITTLFPKPDMQEKLRDFLGAMMVLEEPLPLRDFTRLLGMSDRVAEEINRRLLAFQTRGEINSGVVPPAKQQFHFSFLEFMESTLTEHNGQSIAISTANAHSMLADRCLKLVFSEFLPSYRGKTCAYSELRGVEPYVIKFWPLHLSNGTSRLLLAPSFASILVAIPDEDMRHWAELFLPCIAARFQGEDERLDNVPKHMLLLKLAMIIDDYDVATLSYRLYCLEIAVRLEPIDVKAWIALGDAYDMMYEHGGNNKSLDEQIGVFRHALQLVLLLRPAPHPDRSQSLNNLGNALQTRFEQQGAQSDLDEAISLHQEALLLRPAPHPHRSLALDNLGNALQTRFRQQGVQSDLDEAISLLQEALLLQPAPHPDRSLSLNNLALGLLTRFEHQDASIDLDEAISLLQEALLLQPAPHPDSSLFLNNLGNALRTRFEQQGAQSDLDEAISLYREALFLRPAPHPKHFSSLHNLGIALLICFQHYGALSDLDEAISLYREMLLLQPAPHPDHSLSLNSLGNALYTRFEQLGAQSDLGEAVSLYQEALLLRPAPHPDRSLSLNNLALALETRFEQQDARSDLDEAISLYREALLLRPAPHPKHSSSLYNLGNALLTCFQHYSALSDLDEAISLYREVLLLQPAHHPGHLSLLNNLGAALLYCFKQRGALSDLDEAISFHREALLQPAPDPDRCGSLSNLGNALLACFKQRGAFNDLDEAISSYREALSLFPASHPCYPDRHWSLTHLANTLQTRFEKLGTTSDRDEAISLRQEAEAAKAEAEATKAEAVAVTSYISLSISIHPQI
ncbi:tetratricopeptide repeat-containing protein [Pholiota molesta]|nr:tetratricopeptide repeat-containing protein [Pholiota molesta]